MTRVLLIGIAPDAVDLSDPALPPGLTHDKIAAGIKSTMEDMRSRGWTSEFYAIDPANPETAIKASLATEFDCVVIGGGIRIPPGNLLLLESVINAVHRAAPKATIAFNTSPENSADAASRWIG